MSSCRALGCGMVDLRLATGTGFSKPETPHLEPACADVSIEQLRPHRRENRRANSISATLEGIAIRFRQPSEPVVELGSATLGCLATTVAD